MIDIAAIIISIYSVYTFDLSNQKYFEEHKDTLKPIYLPTASPEFMVLEECWNISKNDLLVLTYYTSFRDFRIKIGQYFRTKRFKFNMRKYLTGYGS